MSRSLGEKPVFSSDEVKDIVYHLLQNYYSGKQLRQLSNEEKGRLATVLAKDYDLSADVISSALGLSEHLVQRLVRAKDFGKQR